MHVNLFRRAGVAVAAVALAAAGIVTAPSVSATSLGTVTVSQSGGTWSFTLPNSASSLDITAVGDSFTLKNNGPVAIALAGSTAGWITKPGAPAGTYCDQFQSAPSNYCAIPANGYQGTFAFTSATSGTIDLSYSNSGTYTSFGAVTVTAPPPPPPTPPAPSVPDPAPVPSFTMTLVLGTGPGAAVCAGGAPTGVGGTWMTLPGAGECSNPAAPDKKLLGWSTSADFPVTVAQRQVSRGWGAYQLTDEAGNVTAIFIPGGQATFVSGPNSLYPIWTA